MGLLSKQDADFLRQLFANELVRDVNILHFTQHLECQYCRETKMILEEVTELSDKIHLDVHNYLEDQELAKQYNVDKIPATIILDEDKKNYGIRYFGIPSGYEFTTLIEDIKMVSKGDSGLTEKTRRVLAKLTTDLHIQIFITPTCPHCPKMVRLAHQMAFESEHIVADMIESIEFPHLANKYNVYAVPKVVINDSIEFEGALPEHMALEYIALAGNLNIEEI